MSHKLLIACYFFPPCPSIGGRRSAKFAKYLAKMGDEIHVIQAKNPFPGTSPWQKDIAAQKNIHTYELPLNYPVEFVVPPSSLIGKVRYRLYNYYFDLFYSSWNRFDYTIFWEKSFLKKAEELIQAHNIKNILVSGPPFYYAAHAVKLKDKFPDLNIIVDFRDPWIGSPYYGMNSLKKKQQDFEISLMNQVYKRADYFTGPNSFLLNAQKEFITDKNSPGAQFTEVPHAYDRDEVAPFLNLPKSSSCDKIRLVYGGQLYPGTTDILKAFSTTLSQLKHSDPGVYNKLEIDLYTPETDRAELFKEHPGVVRFHRPIGNGIMEKIAQATFCLIFLADHNKDFRTTKFLEYSILRRPFIVFGNKGYVAEFVESNNLGKAFDESSIGDLGALLSGADNFIDRQFDHTFDFSSYEFAKVTEGLRSLLK